jgi:hypothetical protein
MQWEIDLLPAYSPDILLCYYHLFGPLSTFLSNKKNEYSGEVKTELDEFITMQSLQP